MADQDHRALVVAEHVLEHVERFEVEIVGRLVQHQQVRGLGQRAGQHQPAALAAREHLTGVPRCSWANRKSFM